MDAPEARLPRIAVTPDEAAIVTGRTRTRIFEALKNGEIAGRKDGKAVVIEISELERWVRSFPTRGRQAATPAAADGGCCCRRCASLLAQANGGAFGTAVFFSQLTRAASAE
jgi:hypothetical protein